MDLEKPQLSPKLSKKWAILSISSVILLYFCPVWAESPAQTKAGVQTLQVWDKPVAYELILENKPHAFYDGAAYSKKAHGQTRHFIVLNRSPWVTEARQIFQRQTQMASLQKLSPEKWAELRKGLGELQQRNLSTQAARLELLGLLSLAELVFERQAWGPACLDLIKQSSSLEQASSRFTEIFLQSREQSIQAHEAAHIFDLMHYPELSLEKLTKDSELNAFFAELAYGSNPFDVLTQTMAGIRSELAQGKSTDYSLEKFMILLQHLEARQSSKTFSLTSLLTLKPQEFAQAGVAIYQHYSRKSSSNLAVR